MFGGKKESPPPTQAAAPQQSTPAPATPPTPAPTPASPPAPSPDAGAGTIAVTTDPTGAKLYLDGAAQAKRSNATLDPVAAGSHTVRVEKSGYVAQERQVEVAADQTANMSFRFQPSADAAGTLVIRATPWATYYVDDKLEGTPNSLSARIQVRPGVHIVRAVNANFDPKVWNNVRVDPNATVTLETNFLTNTVGRLKVPSPGTWAYIIINGANTGKTTPFEFADLKPGKYVVTLQRDGFTVEGGAQNITVLGGETAVANFKLRPVSP